MDVHDYYNRARDNYNAVRNIGEDLKRYYIQLGLLCYTAARPFMQTICLGVMPDCPVAEMICLRDLHDVIMDYGVEFPVYVEALSAIDICKEILIDHQNDSMLPDVSAEDMLQCFKDVEYYTELWYSVFCAEEAKESTVSQLLRQAEG